MGVGLQKSHPLTRGYTVGNTLNWAPTHKTSPRKFSALSFDFQFLFQELLPFKKQYKIK